MAQPFPLQTSFPGMIRDLPRDGLGSALWNCVDYVPDELNYPLRKRGGWSYASDAISTTTAQKAIFYAEFTSGARLVTIGSDNTLYRITPPATTVTSVGLAVSSRGLFFHRNKLIIPCDDGATAPKYWDGTTLGNLAGSPPAGQYGCVYKDFSFLANSSALPTRVWYSVAGAPDSWDTTTKFADTGAPVVGLASLRNAVMVFHSGTTERFIGTPTLSDFALQGLFDVGCADNRSIAVYQDQVIWADTKGVYLSDGAALQDLTAKGGIKGYWRDLLGGALPSPGNVAYASTFQIAGGIYRNHYIVTVTDGTTFRECLACDLNTRRWFRFSNFNFRTFARVGSATKEELYMGFANGARIASISSCWSPSSSVKNDADGTAVTPLFETGFLRGLLRIHRRWIPSPGLQRWKMFYLTADLTDAATDNPILTVSYLTDPNGSYTALSPTFPETTTLKRSRFPGNGFVSSIVALKVAQTNASADTKIQTIEGDLYAREPSRLG